MTYNLKVKPTIYLPGIYLDPRGHRLVCFISVRLGSITSWDAWESLDGLDVGSKKNPPAEKTAKKSTDSTGKFHLEIFQKPICGQ